MLTVRHAWVGLVIFLLAVLLVLAAVVYWQHAIGVNTLHLLAYIPFGDIIHGC